MRVFVFILPISKNSIFYHFYFPSWSRTSLFNCFILVLSLFHVLWRLFYEFVLTFKFSFIFSMSRSKLVWISSTWMFSCFNLSFDCNPTLKLCMAREFTLQFWIFLSHAAVNSVPFWFDNIQTNLPSFNSSRRRAIVGNHSS